MATVELTKENFEEKVLASDIAIIDFWAPWCAPCKTFGPVFESVSEDHGEILFGKVNSEDEQEIAAHFNIRSIPTLVVIRDKVVIFSQAGALPKEALDDLVKQAAALDMEKVHAEIAKQQAGG
jgi:thioredoxin 1